MYVSDMNIYSKYHSIMSETKTTSTNDFKTVKSKSSNRGKDYTPYDFTYYKFKPNFRIEGCSLGVLMHRLVKHCINIKAGKYGHIDKFIPHLDTNVLPIINEIYNLYNSVYDRSHGAEMINKIFGERNYFKRTKYGTKRYSFKSTFSHCVLDEKAIGKYKDRADVFLLGLLSGIKSRVSVFATEYFGKRYTKEVEKYDAKQKRKRKMKETVDNRKYKGVLCDASVLVFEKLDELEKVVMERVKVMDDLFGPFIEKTIAKQEENKKRFEENKNKTIKDKHHVKNDKPKKEITVTSS